MAMLFCKQWKTEAWLAALRAADPGVDIRVYPDLGEESDIEFALVWAPPAGLLASLPNLRAVQSIGAGVEHLFADPQLPPQLPIARVVDTQLVRHMTEYVVLHGERHDVLKVLDFGLVKEMHNPRTRDITQFAKVLGTPLYMAPERLRNPADADARADIYALGAVAHFIISGHPLFEARTDHDLVYQVLNVEAPSLASRSVPRVPAALERLVQRCLAKDREARPASIDDMEAALAEVARLDPWSESDARAWWAARPGLLA